ncbi:MAG TPA: winged helix-turn-helix domain-containing protein, partial [Prosthecobacter sp.]
LGRRQLYPTLSRKGAAASSRTLVDIMAYCDGNHDVVDVANVLGKPAWDLFASIQMLHSQQLLRTSPQMALPPAVAAA